MVHNEDHRVELEDHRAELVATLIEELRDNAGRGLLLHQAIAESFGLNSTDLKCVDLARREQNLTAGRLSQILGISNSAVTAVLDRLERADFIKRQRGMEDRRHVFVVSTSKHETALSDAYAPFRSAFVALLRQYQVDELELIINFTRQSGKITRDLLQSFTSQRDGS